MRQTKRKRGRPPKNPPNNNKYLSSSKSTNKYTIDDDGDDNNSNDSSTTTNTSRSSCTNNKYQTRSSGRISARLNSTINDTPLTTRKKCGRKRKKVESEDELCDDDYYDEPAPQSDEDFENNDDEDDNDDNDDDDEMDDEFEEENDVDDELEEETEEEDVPGKKRRPREKAPVFLDDQELPELVLPSSSKDLLLSSGNDLIRALGVYEILRHFSNTLRLSPFRFEDFCVSLLIDEQTYLLSEIHIQLLKSLIREDDLIGTQHGPQDIRDSISIYLYLCDHVTWPEVLKIYLSSDHKKNQSIIENCLNDSYPFTCLDKKLTLLEHLCDDFLNTQVVRDAINSEGKLDHDEFCRSCQKNGEMLMCDTCSAVFHLSCLDPPLKQVPEHEWYCPICKQNQVTGVTDCINEYERQLQRQEPIGWDRHGRQYWFLARRIIVEDIKSNKVWYYSTRLQYDELVECLDDETYESDLCKALSEIQNEIYRQMIITEKLTKIAKGSRKSYLEVVNEEIFLKQSSKLRSESNESNETTINDKIIELETKLVVDEEDIRNGGAGMQTRLKTGTLPQRSLMMNPLRNQSSLYNTIQAFRDEDTVIIMNDDEKTLTRTHRRALPLTYFQINLFLLGFEGNYRNYQNIYSLIPMALSRNQTQDDRDRRRYLSHKFSLTPISDLKWASYNQIVTTTPVTTAYGPKPMLINVLRQALLQFESNFPNPFMHPNWRRHRDNWIKAVKICSEPKEFGLALYILESSMKPVLFNNAWNDILGFIVLQRSTQLERDELKKKEKKSLRSNNLNSTNYDLNELMSVMLDPTNNDTSKYNPLGNAGVKLVIGKLRHQIWKQKGEEFRLAGIGGWYWFNSIRNLFKNDHNNSEIKDLSKNEETTTTSNNKNEKSIENNSDIKNENTDIEMKNEANENASNSLKNEPIHSEIVEKNVDDNDNENYVIKISESLSENDLKKRKKFYPKIYPKTKLDKMLSLITAQLELERKQKKNDEIKDDDSKDKIMNEQKIDQNIKSRSSSHYCCYSIDCDSNSQSKLRSSQDTNNDDENNHNDHSCYSPLCQFLSKNSVKINVKNDNFDDDRKESIIDDEKLQFKDLTAPVQLQKIIVVDGVEQFAKKVNSFLSKGQLPPSTRFTIGNKKSIFVPLNYELRQLGRSGGEYEVSGFHYNAKINSTLWPYGLTPRPSFRTTWLYRVYNLQTLHCVALHLRVLWASVRWDDLAQKPPISGTNTITTDMDVQTIEILKRRDMPPFGLRSEYRVRKITVPIDVPIYRSREISTPNRSGLRERRRAESPQNKGPRMEENWVREEELELWEIKQFNDKQIQLAKQKALQEQRQKELEMKRKLQETGSLHNKPSIDSVRIVNGSNINLSGATPTKTLSAKFSTLITNRTPIKTNILNTPSTVHPTIATVNTIPYGSTIHTSNGQTLRLQTPTSSGQTKPSSPLYIRPGNNIQFITTSNAVTTPNRAQTYIVRTPMSTGAGNSTRPILISSTLNTSPIFRTVNTINSNIRHSIPIIATNCPKKISTSTTVNAILTTNTMKTVTTTTTVTTFTTATATLSSSSSTSTTTSSIPSTLLSTINVAGNNSKNLAFIPIRLNDGRTHFLPINTLSTGTTNNNQTVQINLNPNNQIRLPKNTIINASSSTNTTPGIISIANAVGGSNDNQPKTIFVARNNNTTTMLPASSSTTASTTSFNTYVLTNANNQKVIFHTSNSPASSIPSINQIGLKTVQIGNQTTIAPTVATTTPSTTTVNKINQSIIRNPNVVTTAQQTDPIPPSTLSKAINVSNEVSSKETDEKDFVVTSEMTQDIVRKALMNPNVAPEIAQKLLALQKHHQEQQSPNDHYHSHDSDQQIQSSIDQNDTSNNYNRKNSRLLSSSSSSVSSSTSSMQRGTRYSRSKYNNSDSDYIYEYPHSERHHKTSRLNRDEKEDLEHVCENIVRHLIDKIEKVERSQKQKEQVAERKHRKAVQMKIKYRQNHTEAIRRNILRRKSVFNQNIKYNVDREIEEKLKILHQQQQQQRLQQQISTPIKSPILKTTTASDTMVDNHENHSNNKMTTTGLKHKIDNDSNKLNNSNEKITTTPENGTRTHKRPRLTNSSTNKSSSSTNSNDHHSSTNNVANNTAKSNNHQNVNHSQKKSPKNRTTTSYCICNRLDDKSMMIACDDCGRWYHIRCINMDKQEADDLEQYFCSECADRNPKLNNHSNHGRRSNSNNKISPKSSSNNVQQQQPQPRKGGPGRKPKHHRRSSSTNNVNNNLKTNHNNTNNVNDEDDGEYCICKEKYESEKFYIYCDQCNEWFHGRCVGITFTRAEQIDEYFCPKCQGEQSQSYRNIQPIVDDDYLRMEKIVKSVKTHRSAWPFLKPVDGKQVPDYYTIIKEPMDLQKITNRINGHDYRRLSEFIYDMYKIFDNCRYYNDKNSQYYYFANTLEEFFEKKLREQF